MINFLKSIFKVKYATTTGRLHPSTSNSTDDNKDSKISIICSIKEKIIQEGSFSKIEIVKEKNGSIEVNIFGTSEIDGSIIASSFLIHPKDEEEIFKMERNNQKI